MHTAKYPDPTCLSLRKKFDRGKAIVRNVISEWLAAWAIHKQTKLTAQELWAKVFELGKLVSASGAWKRLHHGEIRGEFFTIGSYEANHRYGTYASLYLRMQKSPFGRATYSIGFARWGRARDRWRFEPIDVYPQATQLLRDVESHILRLRLGH